ncbi:MAG: methyl-accepting chemotaxis protein [Sedimenticola sp.]|uniref:Methyl-accepting chemotaxis protein n=1 Tax=Sedimenticola thiotaurini TaxID=1543721 RepID=A0A558CL23_9GAMM|nr:methyl-accepting chemotaxis protein [Sedimenticola sp.]MCW8976093.1 methyl-accepting chemotaxis protein [Sedimenticola sp.]MDF1528609.1 methyl-accepting chemotaxis protein [Sedimenticola sp.]TVT49456.1 MAG: methyl-accepting chemotaxis protein [Sedimenticola thiotaurini]
MNQASKHTEKGLSISTKIDLALVFLFLVILLVSALYQFNSQRNLVEELVMDQTETLADSYFDNVNTLMLTGGMANKEIARKKVTAREEVLDARIIRGEGIIKLFGAGNEQNKIKDDLDKRALAGEKIDSIIKDERGRVLTVVIPMRAEKDYRGTNCLLCHPVTEGDVLGAVRVDFSLKKLDNTVFKELWFNIGLNSILLIAGLLIISFILKKLVVSPIRKVTHLVRAIEQDSDLTLRAEVRSNDELGRLAIALNKMMEKFSSIITHINASTVQLAEESIELTSITTQSIEGVRRQQNESQQVATAMTEMEANSNEVANSAKSASDAANQADEQAIEGGDVVNNAITCINALAKDVDQAFDVIRQLESDSDGIGKVVEVITNIAEQTNLLALNAAIEAARAGEQGRGFAVVADEVRTLATRTHKATQEIQTMIEGLQRQSESAANMMSQSQKRVETSVAEAAHAGESLNRITQSINTISQMNEHIASASHQQSLVVSEISRNITAISDVTGQTAENSEKIAHTSQQLSNLAAELKQVMGQFKV